MQQNNIQIKRDNQNYLYLKDIFKSIKDKRLIAQIMSILILNRLKEYENFKLLDDHDYLKIIKNSDLSFRLSEKMYFKIDNKEIELKKRITKNYIAIEDSLNRFKIKINYDDNFEINKVIELPFNKPLNELLESITLAKKLWERYEVIINDKYNLYISNTEITKTIFEIIKGKRNKAISLNEKITDLLFLIDGLLMKINQNELKKELYDYYYHYYLGNALNLDYFAKEYSNRLIKDANSILERIFIL
jgi:hypothetical protein